MNEGIVGRPGLKPAPSLVANRLRKCLGPRSNREGLRCILHLLSWFRYKNPAKQAGQAVVAGSDVGCRCHREMVRSASVVIGAEAPPPPSLILEGMVLGYSCLSPPVSRLSTARRAESLGRAHPRVAIQPLDSRRMEAPTAGADEPLSNRLVRSVTHYRRRGFGRGVGIAMPAVAEGILMRGHLVDPDVEPCASCSGAGAAARVVAPLGGRPIGL